MVTSDISSSIRKLTFISMAFGALWGNQFGMFFEMNSAIDGEVREYSENSNFELARHESLGFLDDVSEKDWKLLKQRVKVVYPNVKGGNVAEIRNKPIKARAFYQDHFEPNFSCHHERRIGQLGDGGKWVCDPHRLQENYTQKNATVKANANNTCLVYSIGSNGETSFEQGVKNEIGSHCEVHVFDMRDYSEVVEAAGGIFHQWGISDKGGTNNRNQQLKSLPETIQELGHVGRTVDILKIDCESCEWSAFPAFFDSGVEFRQILIELHASGRKGSEKDSLEMPVPVAYDFFEAMQQHGYVIFHKEVNIRWWRFGECIEYAFLKLHEDFFKGILPV